MITAAGQELNPSPRRVLLVCTGNTCRSPMAQVILQDLLESWGLHERWTVMSAGVHAVSGASAAAPARRVMAEWGLNLSDHRARDVNGSALAGADLVLAMTVAQRDELRRRFPENTTPVYTLKEYVDPKAKVLDVEDPFGGDDTRYRNAAEELRQLLERVVARWAQEAGITKENLGEGADPDPDGGAVRQRPR